MAQNDSPPPLSGLSWKAGDAGASLEAVRNYVEGEANSFIRWYYDRKRPKALMSWWLRLLAIIFTGLGGLVPIIAVFGPPTISIGPLNIPFGQIGYLLLALAAGFVLFDKYFGFSTGWIRYISTAMKLERLRDEFRLDWARLTAKLGGEPPTPEQIEQLIERCRGFSSAVKGQVEQETQAWVAEFQSSLSELQKEARARFEAASNGSIQLAVSNGTDTDDGFSVSIDEKLVLERVFSAECEIPGLEPGVHTLTVTGTLSQVPARASSIVVVRPNGSTAANLTLVKVRAAGDQPGTG